YWKTGNPVFQYLIHLFRSPYFATDSSLWTIGFHEAVTWRTPYDLTFRSPRFIQGRDGAWGFQYFLFLAPPAICALSYRAVLGSGGHIRAELPRSFGHTGRDRRDWIGDPACDKSGYSVFISGAANVFNRDRLHGAGAEVGRGRRARPDRFEPVVPTRRGLVPLGLRIVPAI